MRRTKYWRGCVAMSGGAYIWMLRSHSNDLVGAKFGIQMSKKGSFWHFSANFLLPDPPSRGGSSGTLIIRRDGLPSWQRGAIGERSPCFTATFWPPPPPPILTPFLPLFAYNFDPKNDIFDQKCPFCPARLQVRLAPSERRRRFLRLPKLLIWKGLREQMKITFHFILANLGLKIGGSSSSKLHTHSTSLECSPASIRNVFGSPRQYVKVIRVKL